MSRSRSASPAAVAAAKAEEGAVSGEKSNRSPSPGRKSRSHSPVNRQSRSRSRGRSYSRSSSSSSSESEEVAQFFDRREALHRLARTEADVIKLKQRVAEKERLLCLEVCTSFFVCMCSFVSRRVRDWPWPIWSWWPSGSARSNCSSRPRLAKKENALRFAKNEHAPRLESVAARPAKRGNDRRAAKNGGAVRRVPLEKNVAAHRLANRPRNRHGGASASPHHRATSGVTEAVAVGSKTRSIARRTRTTAAPSTRISHRSSIISINSNNTSSRPPPSRIRRIGSSLSH